MRLFNLKKVRLFKLTKKVSEDWFIETHKAIDESTKHSELERINNAIEMELMTFSISSKDVVRLIMLRARCNLRYHILTDKIKRENQYLKQIINN